MSKAPKRRGEFDLIAKYFAPLSRSAPGALNLTDDAAYFTPRSGFDLVVTTDAVIEGIHFFADDPAESVARKALRVNLSDLAAKGARPRGYLLTLALPARIREAWVKSFAKGLEKDQAAFGIVLLGGDTTGTAGPLMVNIVAIGEVPQGKMLVRGGAKVGDDVWVSGTIGDASLGLRVLKRELSDVGEPHARAVVSRYRVPEPRCALGLELVGLAHASIDVSDGLVADLGHICDVSKVAIRIAERSVPLSSAAKAYIRSGIDVGVLLGGGDDYELAFTASPSARERLGALAARGGVPLARIGEVVAGRGIAVMGEDGRPLRLPRAGYTHF
jgi:thiamine-monophosphate kinase